MQDDVLSLDATPPVAAAKSLGGTGEEINEDDDSSGDENGQGHSTRTALRSAQQSEEGRRRDTVAHTAHMGLTWPHLCDLFVFLASAISLFLASQITATTVLRTVTASPTVPC